MEINKNVQEIIGKINKFWSPQIGHLSENQRDKIIEILLELDPKYALEIGFAGGRQTTTVLGACPMLKRMISVDINLNAGGGRPNIELIKAEFGQTIEFIENDSSILLNGDFFKENFENGLDYIFVDGSHTYAGAKYDMQVCYPSLNNRGIMIVDDYMSGPPDGCPIQSVTNAVNDFAKENQLSFETWNVKGKGLAIFAKNN